MECLLCAEHCTKGFLMHFPFNPYQNNNMYYWPYFIGEEAEAQKGYGQDHSVLSGRVWDLNLADLTLESRALTSTQTASLQGDLCHTEVQQGRWWRPPGEESRNASVSR